MTRVRIENVVASSSLGDSLDLERVAPRIDGAEYEPSAFPGLIYRLKSPKTAVLLFRSGKVVCTGGKSRKEIEESIRIVSGLLRKAGQKVVAHPKIEVQNIVATSDLGVELNLQAVAVAFGLDRVEYEPEQFPGLVVRLESPRVVLLLFGSGKLVCTGARNPADVGTAVERIREDLDRAGLLGPKRATLAAASAETGGPSDRVDPATVPSSPPASVSGAAPSATAVT